MIAGRYKIISELGSGGMATVFLAEDSETSRRVALKVLTERAVKDREYVQRFFREARIIASLKHPAIIEVYESNFTADKFYLVMEYVSGGDLRSLILKSSLSYQQKIRILFEIACGLGYAHQQGVVHRDIKPSNILLTADLHPKICDFGIATQLWGKEFTDLTTTHEVMGTIDYIAPEQKESTRNVDFRADIYSFGVIAYLLLTGQKPLGVIKDPHRLNPGISIALSQLLLSCLEMNRNHRPQNMEIVAEALNNELIPENRRGKNEKAQQKEEQRFEDMVQKLETGSLSEKIQLKDKFIHGLKPEDTERILALFPSSSGILREALIKAIGRLKIVSACSLLLPLLNDPLYCKIVAEAIAELNCPEAERALLKMLRKNDEFSPGAILPLAKLRSGEAFRFISRYLFGQPVWLRQLALEAISLYNNKNSLLLMEKVARQDESAEIRALAKKLIRRLE